MAVTTQVFALVDGRHELVDGDSVLVRGTLEEIDDYVLAERRKAIGISE